MDELEQDGSEVLETTEEIVDEQVETAPEPDSELLKEIEDLKKKNAQLFERAKKAETKPKDDSQFSPKDYLALTEAKVSSEDFDEIVRVSKILDKTVAETLKDKTMQSILNERQEERRTAEATATGRARSAPSKQSGEDLLNRAAKGDLPDSDADIAKLAEASLQRELDKRARK